MVDVPSPIPPTCSHTSCNISYTCALRPFGYLVASRVESSLLSIVNCSSFSFYTQHRANVLHTLMYLLVSILWKWPHEVHASLIESN